MSKVSAVASIILQNLSLNTPSGYFYKPISPANGPWTFVPDADLPIDGKLALYLQSIP
jgi:hypothetical protein